MRFSSMRLLVAFLIAVNFAACDNRQGSTSSPAPTSAKSTTPITLQLNWVAEPEFGGFYAAKEAGLFQQHGLDVDIRAAGAGSNVIQMVERGVVEFGVVSADEIVIARAKGADLVAVFTVYQNCPQGIMTHAEKSYQTLAEVFAQPTTLAAEPGLAYVAFLKSKFGESNVRVIPYTYNIQPFVNDPDLAQQCFITSEPILARRQGADVRVFPVGDSGFDPYTAVVVVRGEYLKQNPVIVKEFVAAARQGWRKYLDNPAPTNQIMGKLNTNMDQDTFAAAADAQKPLIENQFTLQHGLGAMSSDRWKVLASQLLELKIIDHAPFGEECFVDVMALP